MTLIRICFSLKAKTNKAAQADLFLLRICARSEIERRVDLSFTIQA